MTVERCINDNRFESHSSQFLFFDTALLSGSKILYGNVYTSLPITRQSQSYQGVSIDPFQMLILFFAMFFRSWGAMRSMKGVDEGYLVYLSITNCDPNPLYFFFCVCYSLIVTFRPDIFSHWTASCHLRFEYTCLPTKNLFHFNTSLSHWMQDR